MLIKRIGSLDAAHPDNIVVPTSTEEIVDRNYNRREEYKFNNNSSGLTTEKGIKHISLGEVFTNLVEYLTQGEEFIAYDLIMVGFKIFIKYIQTDGKNSLATDEDSETDMDADLKAKNTLIHKQNTLLQYNTCDLIFKTIKNDYAIIIKEQALILGIEILEGGNYNAQMTFLQYIKDDVDNEFLIAIKQLLDNSFELIKKYMLTKNDILLNEVIGENIKLEYVDASGDDKMIQSMREIDDLIPQTPPCSVDKNLEDYTSQLSFSSSILRFLQLLCEGHNLD